MTCFFVCVSQTSENMETSVRRGREGLRSATKFCDMFGTLTFEDQDQDYSIPKG